MIKNVILIAGCGIAVVVAAYSVSECIKQRNKTIQKRKRLEAVETEYAIDIVKRRLEAEKQKGGIEDDVHKLLNKVDRTLKME